MAHNRIHGIIMAASQDFQNSCRKLDHFLDPRDNGDDEEPEEEPGPEDHLLHDLMIFKEGVQSLIGGNTGLLGVKGVYVMV